MRDVILATIIFGSLPVILVRPWFGIIMWCWISFMNPHRMAWGFMFDMNIAMIIAITTLVGWALTNEDRRIPVNAITVLMFLLALWTCVTTYFAAYPIEGVPQWKQFMKVIFMTFILMSLMKKETYFRYLVWITALSVGYFGFKGGIFTLLTGGQFRVWGPPDTFIEDNNALALALLMIIPLIVYLAQTIERRWFTLCMYGFAGLCLVSVIGSYSRGGFLGMAAIATLLWARSKRKMLVGTLAVVSVTTALMIIPQKWFARMDTIENYQADASAEGRLEIWSHAIRIANDSPIVGGGFGVFGDDRTYQRLTPNISTKRNVHSIYFEMLATQGYVGLILFLLLGSAGLLTAQKIKRLAKGKEGFERELKFANLIQISLVAYAVSGAFQNLSTYDVYYALLAMIALKYASVKEKLKAGAPQAVPSSARAAGVPQTEAPVPAGALPAHMPGRSFLRTPSH